MADPAGEADGGALRLDFDRRVMLRFHGSAITSDGGLLAYRELDDALALTASGGERLAEARTGRNRRHLLVGLLRQSVFGRLAGYEDVNDADRLSRDPAMRWVVGGNAPMGRAASASQMAASRPSGWRGRRTSPLLPICRAGGSTRCTSGASRRSSCWTWIRAKARATANRKAAPTTGISAAPVITRCFVFNQLGDLERSALRPGNVHSADGWREVLEPVVSRYQGKVKRLCFRGDAAFANPEVYEFLEAEGMGYAIRLPANRVLQDKIGYLLKRPVGRPPQDVRRYYASFRYQAGSWTKPRRVVAKCLPSRRRGSSGIRVSFIRASALSSPTWRGRWSASSPSITTAAPQSSGSKRARARSSGPPVVPILRRQRRPPPAPRAGLQSRQFHADAGDAEDGGAVVADQPAREADQDRCQGREPRPLHHLPDGRGGSAAADVPGDSVAHRPPAAAGSRMTGRSGQM